MVRTIVLAAVASLCATAIVAQDGPPTYVVDPFWPKDLPENWTLGQVASVAVDNQDSVWVLHRPRTLVDDEKGAQKSPPETRCCQPAPSVLQFAPDGRLLRSWAMPMPGRNGQRTSMAFTLMARAMCGLEATTRTIRF